LAAEDSQLDDLGALRVLRSPRREEVAEDRPGFGLRLACADATGGFPGEGHLGAVRERHSRLEVGVLGRDVVLSVDATTDHSAGDLLHAMSSFSLACWKKQPDISQPLVPMSATARGLRRGARWGGNGHRR
jgi:hypothetical protein